MSRISRIHEELDSILKAFLAALARSRSLLVGFTGAVVVGIVASPAIRNIALVVGLGVTLWIAASIVRLRREMETTPSAGNPSFEVTRPATQCDLFLRTLTHLTRIELLIKRPPAVLGQQEK